MVGSGESGCQIAEELYTSGRKVYLCVGSAGRAPRRYRGKDFYEWLHLSGFLDRTVDQLPSPKAKFAANPHVSGRDGGHTINLHQFARDGVVLLGHLKGARAIRVWLAPDLKENLAKADKSAAALLLRSRVGERFDALVTGASSKGTWVRLLHVPVEGKLVQGFEGVDVGDRMRVQLISVDVGRGYIDFRHVGSSRH